MIKQLTRFLMILGCSVLVSGALYLIFTNTSTFTAASGDRPVMEPGENVNGLPFGKGQHVRPEGEAGDGQLNIQGVLLNLGKVSLISGVIILINLVIDKARAKRKQKLVSNG